MSIPERLFTADEYLALEHAAFEKSEFVNGRIYAMSGAAPGHNQLAFNLAGVLYPQLRRGACMGFSSDMRVKVRPTGAYFYPDLAVACGTPEFEGIEPRTLVNPRLVVEISSRSTEAFDRGDKFAHYRRVPTLQEYVLVAQDRVLVERYRRAGDVWTLGEFSAPDDRAELASIGCVLVLRELYERVEFPKDGARRAPRLVREPEPPAYATA